MAPKDEMIQGLSRNDLIELIKEIRKPVKSEKEIREEQQAEADRAAMGETLKLAHDNKIAAQKACTHMRPNGSTTAVYSGEPIFKLYCQACAKWIGPDEPEIFNRLYQLAI